jgi:hypothetical protein
MLCRFAAGMGHAIFEALFYFFKINMDVGSVYVYLD